MNCDTISDVERARGERLLGLLALYEAAKARIARHDATVRAHGGRRCEDDFCTTFRPLVAAAARER